MRYALLLALCGCIGGDPSWEKLTKGDQSHVVVQKKRVVAKPEGPNVTWLLDRPRDDVRAAIVDLIARKQSEFRFGLAFTGSTCGSNFVFPPGTEPGVLMQVLESPPTDRLANWSASLAPCRWAMAADVAAKHGLVGLTRVAALEYAPKGIRVNAVCPGFVETPMLERAGLLGDPAVKRMIADLHAVKRLGRAEEIAEAVLFLASGRASFITGHPLLVDGGYVAQ